MPRLKPYDLSNVTETDLAYLAGFIDGEGCFFIGNYMTKSKTTGNQYRNYHCMIKTANNNLEVLDWIKNTFGGQNTKFNKLNKGQNANFITHSHHFTGNLLTDITQMLLPYLIVKKHHAKVMLTMRATFPRSGSSGSAKPALPILKIRENCHREMHRLNSRFKNHPLKADLY